MILVRCILLSCWCCPFLLATSLPADEPGTPRRYFAIKVVDSETGRGVPLVQLKTVNDAVYYTDSAGWVAFDEPGLMDREVFFDVSSHGYEFAADGFGYRGIRLKTTPGRSSRVTLPRKNVAERVYRLTGQGIYRDSVLLGQPTPIRQPNLNGDVLGQDTVQAALYRGRIHWFWGDTNRPSYPLGQFKTSGATSLLPGDGGLDPAQGVDLKYFVDDQGFSRQMAPLEGPGAIWLHGLFVLRIGDQEKMIAHYARVKSLAERLEHGLVLFNDQTQSFEKLVQFQDDVFLFPRGQSLAYEHGTDDYIYFCTPFPAVRVKANEEAIRDPAQYESYTCLRPGTGYELEVPQVERDESGKLVVNDDHVKHRRESNAPLIERDRAGNVVWEWKKNTGAIDASKLHQLIQQGLLKPAEAKLALFDEANQQLVHLHAGSVHWNAYRNRWIMIAEQLGGETSLLGELWYAEAQRLEGPWENARHIVTHHKYSFYNPTHHVFFDQQDGRVIFFQGTYADTFSKSAVPTPRYNYNQIMYRLDLANPRLNLPPASR
ncbi:MAG: hypothetical protein MI861_10940 [Pirellulales bacterium]|nr:hypothetical protein [Pirellulales bacterium]